MLVIEHVGKSLGGLRVLEDVSITVPAQGLVGLIGPNGAGKSTLFAVVSGFETADGGATRFDDQRLDGLSPEVRARRGLVRTFQVPRQFSHLTVRENLAAAAPGQVGERLWGAFFGGARARREQAEIQASADTVMGFLRLSAVADLPSGKLSGGQRKLL